MLVCDLILQRKCQNFIDLLGEEHYGILCKHINEAQRFVLDKSIAEVADGVEVAEVERVIGQCRLPFERVWLECLHRDRPNFWNGPIYRDQGQIRPTRIALLARTVGGSPLRFVAHLFWSTDEFKDSVSGTMWSIAVDLTDDNTWLEQMKKLRKSFHQVVWEDEKHQIENRISPIPSQYFVDMIMQLPKLNHKDAHHVVHSMLNDWNREPAFWWSVLALLNCRNVAETKHVDISGLNRARAKRGEPLFAEHKILKLRLPTPRHESHPSISSPDRAKVRGHFVRGHFKQRASGLYWWSNFFRGDPSRVLSKSYSVTMREDRDERTERTGPGH